MLKKFKIIIVLASLSITLCLMSNTYSRYVASSNNNVEAAFAKWQILVNTNDITNGSNSEMTFEPTIEASEHVAANKIAPTSTGYFDIDIDPSNVEVSFNYTINLSIQNENIPDLTITKYAIIPTEYVEGDALEFLSLTNNKITNTLNYDNSINSFKFNRFTVRVYFEWLDNEAQTMDDEADTAIGNSAATENTKFIISANIDFEQVI